MGLAFLSNSADNLYSSSEKSNWIMASSIPSSEIKSKPPQSMYPAEQVSIGVTRPHASTNLWQSDSAQIYEVRCYP